MTRERGLRPHEWVGPAPYPWPAVATLQPGDALHACYTVLAGPAGPAAADVVELLLSDVREQIVAEAAIVDAGAIWLTPGSTVGVRATVLSPLEPRIRIAEIAPVQPALEDLDLFIPRSARSVEDMEAELARWIESVSDRPLRTLLRKLLGAETETGRGFRLAPAAMRHHHAVLGGLLEHTLSVVAICDALASHYGDTVDRDLLMTGALLHDVGKVREIGARFGFPYTDEGRLLGHILLGLQMIDQAAATVTDLDPRRLLLLQHLIASHQGRYEWQSPREPRVFEALLLHHADNIDAKAAAALDELRRVHAGGTRSDRPGREWLQHGSAGPDAPGPSAAPTAQPAGDDPVAESVKAGARKKPARRAGRGGGRDGAKRKRGKRKTGKGRGRARSGGARRSRPVQERAGSRRSPARAGPGPPAGSTTDHPSRIPMDPDTIDLFESGV